MTKVYSKEVQDNDPAPCWRWVVHNWTEEDRQWAEALDALLNAFQEEECPETGTPHLQGFTLFPRAYRLSQLKKLHPKAHWMRSKTADYNYEVKREGKNRFVKDNRNVRKKAPNLNDLRAELTAGATMSQVVNSCTSVSQIRFAEQWFKYNEPERPILDMPEFHWRWGPAGVGKTKYIYANYTPFRPVSEKWWEGYDRHDVVLIDEYRVSWCSFERLLVLTDRYPFRVEVKNGSRQAWWTRLYITCNESPEQCFYGYKGEEVEQILRRLTSVTHIPGDDSPC